MKLQMRTALVPLVTVSLLCFGLYELVGDLTVDSFKRVENSILERQVERVNNSIENLVEDHAAKIVDWAQWDKSYEFMKDLNKEYIEVTLNALTISALGYSSVVYLTPENALRYGVTVDGENVKPAEDAFVKSVQQLVRETKANSFQTVVRIEGKIYLLAASQILPNKADQPSRGTLVVVADVPAETLELVAHLTNLKLKFWEESAPDLDATSRGATVKLKAGTSFLATPISDNLIYAYGKISDHKGSPLLFFRVEDSRQIASSAVRLRTFSLSLFSASGLLAALLLVGVIYYSATKRIELFSRQVRDIARAGVSGGQLSDDFQGKHSLGVKTMGGVLLVFVGVTLLTGLYFNRYFLDGFRDIERSVMGDNLERAKRAVEQRLEKIKAKAIDWAQWDDTYNFVVDKNQQYQDDNLGFDTLGHMNMKYVLYYDLESKLAVGKSVEGDKETVVPVDAEVAKIVAAIPQLGKAAEPAAGFANLPSGTIYAGSSPILDTSREKPARGSMVFAALADDSLANELSRQIRLKLNFKKPDAADKAGAFVISPIEDTLIEGKTSVADFSGAPALSLVIRADRPVYGQGLVTVKLLPWYFVIAGFLCAMVTLIWVDRIVLSRIRRMGDEVATIELTGSVAKRVTDGGSDELSGLAKDINSMLVALQKTQRELQTARHAAEAANAAKSMFIAKVSHELRTPIGAITGMNRMILKREKSPAIRDLVKMADQSAWSLLNILNEILDFTKAESGNLTLESINFDIRQVFRETMQLISGRLEGKDELELVVDVSPNVPPLVTGDPTKLKQVLVNLLGNAVKFTQKGYVGLRVETEKLRATDALIKLDIWDTGIGIPEEKQASIFEPFKQADETVTRQFQGTGLGLAIVKQFTDALGGSVSVRSDAGKGTCFTVLLPLKVAGAAEYRLAHASHTWPAAVLVGEGSEVNNTIVKNLTRLGPKCTRVDVLANGGLSTTLSKMREAELLVVTETALAKPDVLDTVVKLAGEGSCAIVAILRPSSLDLKDKLYAAGVKHIFPAPVMADDIALASMGKAPGAESDIGADPAELLRTSKKLRILVADDTPTNRIILEDLLSDAGHSVTLVSDGQELVDKLTPFLKGEPGSEQFDIVLTDISMPIVDGYEATRMVRELERQGNSGIHIPIVAITAHALKDEEAKMQEAGVDGVVTKPVRPEAIAAEIQRLVTA